VHLAVLDHILRWQICLSVCLSVCPSVTFQWP